MERFCTGPDEGPSNHKASGIAGGTYLEECATQHVASWVQLRWIFEQSLRSMFSRGVRITSIPLQKDDQPESIE
jgi:hypothetical protein